MSKLTQNEIINIIKKRDNSKRLDLHEIQLSNIDFSGVDLSNINFKGCDFENINFENAILDRSNMNGVYFKDCLLRNAKLTNADLSEATLRYNDMTNADISGSNLYRSLLEYAILDGVKDDENTSWYRMTCPTEGPFIAWKCGADLKVIQLFVPADAQRASATGETCRCSKAKVLSINNIEQTESYDSTISTINEDFIYRVGEYVYANPYQTNRWMDSSPGIHFFMERKYAVDYQTVGYTGVGYKDMFKENN